MNKKQTAMNKMCDKIDSVMNTYATMGDKTPVLVLMASLKHEALNLLALERQQIIEAHLAGQNSAEEIEGETEVQYFTETYGTE